MKISNTKTTPLILVFVIMLTTACTAKNDFAASPSAESDSTMQKQVSEQDEVEATATLPENNLSGDVIETPTAIVTETPNQEATATEEGEKQRPTPRTGLEATNPSNVKLASGKPQLVEYFAYW